MAGFLPGPGAQIQSQGFERERRGDGEQGLMALISGITLKHQIFWLIRAVRQTWTSEVSHWAAMAGFQPTPGSYCYTAFVVRAPEDSRRLGVGRARVRVSAVSRQGSVGASSAKARLTAGGLQRSGTPLLHGSWAVPETSCSTFSQKQKNGSDRIRTCADSSTRSTATIRGERLNHSATLPDRFESAPIWTQPRCRTGPNSDFLLYIAPKHSFLARVSSCPVM